jgi:hypothetical protein
MDADEGLTGPEKYDRYKDRTLEAWEALTVLYDDPELGSYTPPRLVLQEAIAWLEMDLSCGDCIEGRCHWGGEESRQSAAAAAAGEEYFSDRYGQCGCERHDLSVEIRERRKRLYGSPFAGHAMHEEYTWRQHKFVGLAEVTTDRAKAQRDAETCLAANPGADVAVVTRIVSDWRDDELWTSRHD